MKFVKSPSLPWSSFQKQIFSVMICSRLQFLAREMGYRSPKDTGFELQFLFIQISHCPFIVQFGLGVFVLLFGFQAGVFYFLTSLPRFSSHQGSFSDRKFIAFQRTFESWKGSKVSFLKDFVRLVESLSLFCFLSRQSASSA